MAKLAYILAASHSGSTLLSMLLGAHPDLTTLGELNLPTRAMGPLDRYRCSCGEFIRQCAFWKKVELGMAARGHSFDLSDAGTDFKGIDSRYARRLLRPMHRGPLPEAVRDAALAVSSTWQEQLPRIQARNAALVSTALEITGAQRVVDSSKIGLRLKYLTRNANLAIKIVRLIRDGRAVALTYMDPAAFADSRDPNRRAGGTGGDREHERFQMARAALEWRRCTEEAEHVLCGLKPSQWIEVRYEEYCTHPDDTLSRIYQFLGVDSTRQPKSFRSVEQHVVGNGMRLDTTSEIQLDERWRTQLTGSDLQTFDEIAGDVNRRYGYA